MATRTFTKNFLQSVIAEEQEGAGVVETIEGEHSRWEHSIETVFSYEGKHYVIEWQQGLTESQWMEPLEYAPDNIDVPEVEQVEVVVKKWRKCKP